VVVIKPSPDDPKFMCSNPACASTEKDKILTKCYTVMFSRGSKVVKPLTLDPEIKDLIPPAAGKRSEIVLTTEGCTVVDTSANTPILGFYSSRLRFLES
jgi:hypothetical protein